MGNKFNSARKHARQLATRAFAELERFPPFAFLVRLQGDLRSSYWFIPAVLVLLAILASLATTYLDRRISLADLPGEAWLFSNTADGARAVLSTIASSMITVAGVTFSVTIAAIATTASQFGPRLLTNFMQDRGNQWTLGTFLANFVYGLMILRSVRSGELEAGGFVPHVSVLCAVAFALAGVAVLIYFLNHVPQRIHISNVVARLGHELIERLEALSHAGDEPNAADVQRMTQAQVLAAGGFGKEYIAVPALASGYVQYVFGGMLAECGYDLGAFVVVAVNPGDFVRPHSALAFVHPGPGWETAEREDLAERVREAFALGDERTQAQDPHFLVDTLAEIAARALSPGVNDHVTAMGCISWLSAGMDCAARRVPSSEARRDEKGAVRVLMSATYFDAFCERALEPLRPYIAGDLNTTLATLRALGEVANGLDSAAQRHHLGEHAERLAASARAGLTDPLDREQLESAVLHTRIQVMGTPHHDEERIWRIHAGD